MNPYPSLYNGSNSPLKNAYLQSLAPLRARLHLFTKGSNLVNKLVIDCVNNNVGIDVDLDRDKENIDTTMAARVKAGLKSQPAFELPGVELTPISTDPADYKPYDGDTSTMPELWIQNADADGPQFSVGIDATAFAINGTGHPRCNPRQLTEFVSDKPGENGCIVRTDQFGFRLAPGVHVAKDEKEYQWIAKMDGASWWFERYEKVAA